MTKDLEAGLQAVRDMPDDPMPANNAPTLEEFVTWQKRVAEWASSAFLAGERVLGVTNCKIDLYRDMCRLSIFLQSCIETPTTPHAPDAMLKPCPCEGNLNYQEHTTECLDQQASEISKYTIGNAPDAAGDDARVEAVARWLAEKRAWDDEGTGEPLWRFEEYNSAQAYIDAAWTESIRSASSLIAADPATSRIRALEEANRAQYERGVTDTKKAVEAKLKEMTIYFDRFTCHGGKFASSSGTETVYTDDLIRILNELEVEP